MMNHDERIQHWLATAQVQRLPASERDFLAARAEEFRFTHQELRRLAEIAADFAMWGAPPMRDCWPDDDASGAPKQRRARVLRTLEARREALRAAPNRYPSATRRGAEARIQRVTIEKPRLGLGRCPVASPRTRCCNLMTLDAVENCGFDCSYCSIQSFYHGDEVRFDAGFADKLARLELDPERVHHIGTGQSSDSLMWGNRGGMLGALMDFARRHPNVILELKTKSKNVSYLLRHEIPANVLVTWSLNTQTLIANEEHRTASLDERLRAARRVADRGIVIGFHFHPMIHYSSWREDYGALFTRLTREFSPREVALVSLGTLTFIKPVLKQLRQRPGFQSQVLKMPMVDSDGKLSYPDEIKWEMFRHAWRGLAAWREEVFFYLCMENPRHWKPVFGYEYASNEEFEQAMISAYLRKIEARRAEWSRRSAPCAQASEL